MKKKIAPKGATEMFLRGFVDWDSNECLPWPYARCNKGYGIAVINGKQTKASRWMCILAHGEPPFENAEAAHSCGNPWCVSPRHIRWATPSENQQDRIAHGRTNRGEQDGMAKLTPDVVRKVYSMKGRKTAKQVAKDLPVGITAIYKIWRGERWAHLTAALSDGVDLKEPGAKEKV